MIQDFQSTKHFSVGDIFIRADDSVCYIVRIFQFSKGEQYQHCIEYFDGAKYTHKKQMNTRQLKDKVEYWGWKHIPVVK